MISEIKFFDILPLGKFDMRIVAIKKQGFTTRYQGMKGSKFIYNLSLANLLSSYPFKDAEILFDKHSDSNIMKSLKKKSKELNEGNLGVIKKCAMKDSKQDNLIQLADMVAGAVARTYNSKESNSDRWMKKLKIKKTDVNEI